MIAVVDLTRFVDAQATIYAEALDEIRAGVKRSHWMWFVFPQLAGLGRSETARFYAIASADEARAYRAYSILGFRYRECVEALQRLASRHPLAVFGTIDSVKLRSSLTLFEAVSSEPLFSAALDNWFDGARDQATLDLLDR